MNPQEQLCPNVACGASGKMGHIGIHSQKEGRYRCKVCGRTFSQTKGTAFYRLKKPQGEFVKVATLLAYGCPVQAIVAAFEVDEGTVWAWLRRSGQQAQRVHEQLVLEGALHLEQIQADEMKIKTYIATLWMGLVMMVSTRLWLGGTVEASRSKSLLHRVLDYARQSAVPGEVLVSVDGLNLYLQVIPQVFARRWDWLTATWQGWREVGIVQTMKQQRGQRGQVNHAIACGTPALVHRLIVRSQKQGGINTAYIERLNATFRLRLYCLVRSGRALVRSPHSLEAWMWLAGCVYNFCADHESLRLQLPVSPRRRFWIQRTPAMAAQLTDHAWSVAELLWFKHPPCGWVLSRKTQAAVPLPRYSA